MPHFQHLANVIQQMLQDSDLDDEDRELIEHFLECCEQDGVRIKGWEGLQT